MRETTTVIRIPNDILSEVVRIAGEQQLKNGLPCSAGAPVGILVENYKECHQGRAVTR
jgi:hypothetical protein